jgi:hypothetical protein
VLDLFEVLRCEDDGASTFAHLRGDLPEPSALARVERGRRLVEEQHVGLGEERDREIEPLLVSSREVRGQPTVVGEVEEPDESVCGLNRIGDSLEAGEELEVLPGRETRVMGRTLRYPPDLGTGVVLAPPDQLSLTRRERAGEDREQGRLAGAVGPDESDRFRGVDVEGRRGERDNPPVTARDTAGAQEYGGQRPPPLASSFPRTASTPRL